MIHRPEITGAPTRALLEEIIQTRGLPVSACPAPARAPAQPHPIRLPHLFPDRVPALRHSDPLSPPGLRAVADDALRRACQHAVNRWFGRRRIAPATVWERAFSAPPAARRCAGRQRGYVGVIPDDCRPAVSVTEAFRALRLALGMCGRRADHLRTIEEVARVLLSLTDYQSMLTRPGHATVLERVPVSRRTLQRAIDTLHQLGLLITVEEGTTGWLRRARLRRGHSVPGPELGNRAEVYRWIVPGWAEDFLPAPEPADCPDDPFRTPTAHLTCTKPNVTPSRTSPKERTGRTDSSSRRESAGGYARTVDHPRNRKVTGRKPRRRVRQGWRARSAEVRAVWEAGMPPELIALLADHEAERLANEVTRQLLHRTVDQLVHRLRRHWEFWRFKLAAGLVRRPVAVAFRMLRRDFDSCPDVRCEDGWQLDQDQPCRHCEMTAEHRAAVRAASSSAEVHRPATPSVLAPSAPAPVPPVPPPFVVAAAPLPPARVAQHAARARSMLTAALRASATRRRPVPAPA